MKKYLIPIFILFLFALHLSACTETIEKYDIFDGDASEDSAVYSRGAGDNPPTGLTRGSPKSVSR
jgi:hypothetical protein